MRQRHTAASFADQVGKAATKAAGLLRRVIVDRSVDAVWKLLGHDAVGEVKNADVFSNVGFYSRPRAGAGAEAVVAAIGGADGAVVVATRDEALRQQVADLEEDETAIFTSTAIVKILADGTVEIRSVAGAAVALVPITTLEALRDALVAWVPVPGDGGAALKTLLETLIGTTPPYLWPTPTTVIKGE